MSSEAASDNSQLLGEEVGEAQMDVVAPVA